MEKLLITRDDVNEFFPIGKNLDQGRVLPYILRAQQADLKPFLGDEFYYDFVTNLSNTTNTALYNGGVYLYENRNVYFSGVRQLLAAFAFSRLEKANSEFVTRGGNTKKSTDESEPTPQKNINQISNDTVSEAVRIQADIYKFLDQNRSDYPLWEIGSAKTGEVKRSGFRINKIYPRGTLTRGGF